MVVVVKREQLAQPKVPGQRGRLGSDALLEIAVGGDDVGPMVDDRLPEPIEGAVPNLGRLGVFLAKEILRLHHGEIHAGPGMEGTEILISLRSL